MSWLKRERQTNLDRIVIGLLVALGGSVILAILSATNLFEALPLLAWLIIAAIAAIFLLGVLVGRRVGHRKATEEAEGRIERVSLEAQERIEREVKAVRKEERRLRDERERTAETYAEHISDALTTLESIVSGAIPTVKVRDFVQTRGRATGSFLAAASVQERG